MRRVILVWMLVAMCLGMARESARAAAAPSSAPLVEFRHPSLFPPAPGVGAPVRRIDVDVSAQELVAFEGLTPVRAFQISTGDAQHPTLIGSFSIQRKYARIDLVGRDYYYHDVPYVMMFAKPFYVHAAPWRAEFGVAASRGCVTLATADAAWLFDWTDVGTEITIHW
jgi:lipoprotein-anchoring transpeptidase ErfK/SrfK